MCGITGFVDPRSRDDPALLDANVQRMAARILHRGPDDAGTWVDERVGLAFGFRRLAIIDLSPTGKQPMLSADEHFVIIFNGEVYNFVELRKELIERGETFRGTSDTEVILSCICHWGLIESLSRFNGMYAFALWDRSLMKLHLVRDHLGIKPLYYGWNNGVFLFGSELKTLRAHPDFQGEINRDALSLYLRHNYIPAPYSIYTGIHKLTPGCVATLDLNDLHAPLIPQPYWTARRIAEQNSANPLRCSDEEAISALDSLLRDGIQQRMIADVPLGAFLSGGVDSSNVVALMQAVSDRPVRTFTIGFTETDYNEAAYAAEIARHLGTEHTEIVVSPETARSVIPMLPGLYDEPFADSSQIPTYLVSQLARQHVTVSLSGDGGDELFTGYNRYFWGERIWRTAGWIPARLRRSITRPLSKVRPESWMKILKTAGPLAPQSAHQPQFADKMQKLLEVLEAGSPQALYRQVVSLWKEPDQVVLNGHEPTTALNDTAQWANVPDFKHWMMYLDLITYLPDDILVKLDRASMGVSLESRVPYLDDRRVIEFAWRTPPNMKVRDGQSKWLLRQVLYQYVPPRLIERPKMGFAIPIDTWLRGPLRNWAEQYLQEDRLRKEGFFNPEPIRQKWEDHLSGRHNWQYPLWGILMFQTWLEAQGKSA